MYSIGYATAILYVASLTFFVIGMFKPEAFKICSIIGGALFVMATLIIGLMIAKRHPHKIS